MSDASAPAGGDTVVASIEKKIRNGVFSRPTGRFAIIEDTLLTRDMTAELKPVKLEVIPAYGDPNGSHVTILVVSDAFEGKRSLQRQQMVYKVRRNRARGCNIAKPS